MLYTWTDLAIVLFILLIFFGEDMLPKRFRKKKKDPPAK